MVKTHGQSKRSFIIVQDRSVMSNMVVGGSLRLVLNVSVLDSPFQPQRGRGIRLPRSSCGATHALEVDGLKGDQLHQTGLTNGRCCEIHYPLSQQRGRGDPETVATWKRLPNRTMGNRFPQTGWNWDVLVSAHIHNKNTNRRTKAPALKRLSVLHMVRLNQHWR